jgi:hypothetical protein
MGLVVPPQITDAMSGDNQAIQEILPDFSDMFNEEPTFNDDFQFNPEDGTFSFSLNFTSPLNISLPVNSFSLTVSDENGSILGTISLGDPLVLVSSQTSMIPFEGNLSHDIRLTNVNLDIGGIQLHIDELNSNELFGSQESD